MLFTLFNKGNGFSNEVAVAPYMLAILFMVYFMLEEVTYAYSILLLMH